MADSTINIKQVYDIPSGYTTKVQFYPETSTQAIYTSSGELLQTYLDKLEQSIANLGNTATPVYPTEIISQYGSFESDVTSATVVANKGEAYWHDYVPQATTQYPNIWKRFRLKYSDGTLGVYQYEFVGSKGATGIDSEWKEWIFKLTVAGTDSQTEDVIKNSLSKELADSESQANFQDDDCLPSGSFGGTSWTDDMQEITEKYPLLWVASRIKKSGVWSSYNNLHIFERKATDGINTNNIYTIIPYSDQTIESEKWETDKQLLLENLRFDSETGTIYSRSDGILDIGNTNYTWYDYLPNTTSTDIVYQVTVYFQSYLCVNIDEPIRMTGPNGVGTDGEGVEYTYYATDAYDVNTLPEMIGAKEHYNTGDNNCQWYDHASEQIISKSTPYQFMCTRQGNYTDDSNWHWVFKVPARTKLPTTDFIIGKSYKFGKSISDTSIYDYDDYKEYLEADSWNFGWSTPTLWSTWGTDGVDGDGIQYVYLRITSKQFDLISDIIDNTSVSIEDLESRIKLIKCVDEYGSTINPTTTETVLNKESYPITQFTDWQLDGEYSIWTDNPSGVNEEYPYELCWQRTYSWTDSNQTAKQWDYWGNILNKISVWSHYGQNSVPYSLELENPYEAIYVLENYGSSKKNYVILDEDGVTTGNITLHGGYSIDEDLSIDTLYITNSSNELIPITDNSTTNVFLGDGWYCKFEYTKTESGKSTIKLIGISQNANSEIKSTDYPDTAQTTAGTFFEDDIQGKYQKKIVITAKNNEKKIEKSTTWVISAVYDKNGDGVYRYRLTTNIDRITKHARLQKNSSGNYESVSQTWNIGSAVTLTCYAEKDTYGKTWELLENQNCRVILTDLNGDNQITTKANTSGTLKFDSLDLQNFVNSNLASKATEASQKQYLLELQVEDPDYETESSTHDGNITYSTVDKCSLTMEYLVTLDGADGKDGESGTSVVLNLTNDSATFAYDYINKKAKINENDNSTSINLLVNESKVVPSSITIGGNKTTTDNLGTTQQYKLTENAEYVNYTVSGTEKTWNVTITDININTYCTVIAIPITVSYQGQEIGTVTFKLTCVQDTNGDGVYSYKIVPSTDYVNENSTEYLSCTVYRNSIIQGTGYNDIISFSLVSTYKDGKPCTTNAGSVSVGNKYQVQNICSLADIQAHRGLVLHLYVQDDDYKDRAELSNHYDSGEIEEVTYTAIQGQSIAFDLSNDSIPFGYDESAYLSSSDCSSNINLVIDGNYKLCSSISVGNNIYSTSTSSSNIYNFTSNSSVTYNISKNTTNWTITFKSISISDSDLNSDLTIPIYGIYDSDKVTTTKSIRFTGVIDFNNDGIYGYKIELDKDSAFTTETSGNSKISFKVHRTALTPYSNGSTTSIAIIAVISPKIANSFNEELITNKTVSVSTPTNFVSTSVTLKAVQEAHGALIKIYATDPDYQNFGKLSDTYNTYYYTGESEEISYTPSTIDTNAIDQAVGDYLDKNPVANYYGSGSFKINFKENGQAPTATFTYNHNVSEEHYEEYVFVRASNTGDNVTLTINPTNSEATTVYLGTAALPIKDGSSTVVTPETTYTWTQNGNSIEPDYANDSTSYMCWNKCYEVRVTIGIDGATLIEDVVAVTATNGYFFNADNSGFVSMQSLSDSISSINQTAEEISTRIAGVEGGYTALQQTVKNITANVNNNTAFAADYNVTYLSNGTAGFVGVDSQDYTCSIESLAYQYPEGSNIKAGEGYIASGNISWDKDGNLTIKGDYTLQGSTGAYGNPTATQFISYRYEFNTTSTKFSNTIQFMNSATGNTSGFLLPKAKLYYGREFNINNFIGMSVHTFGSTYYNALQVFFEQCQEALDATQSCNVDTEFENIVSIINTNNAPIIYVKDSEYEGFVFQNQNLWQAYVKWLTSTFLKSTDTEDSSIRDMQAWDSNYNPVLNSEGKVINYPKLFPNKELIENCKRGTNHCGCLANVKVIARKDALTFNTSFFTGNGVAGNKVLSGYLYYWELVSDDLVFSFGPEQDEYLFNNEGSRPAPQKYCPYMVALMFIMYIYNNKNTPDFEDIWKIISDTFEYDSNPKYTYDEQ